MDSPLPPIIGGLVTFLSDRLNFEIWEGEVPRQGSGITQPPIDPPATVPVIRVIMTQRGLDRDWTFNDLYADEGPITIQVWCETRYDVEKTWLPAIIRLLSDASNWGGILSDGYQVFGLIMTGWTCVPDNQLRVKNSELLYRGDLRYKVMIKGAVATG